MRLPSVKLTPFASAHDLLGIGDYHRPIEPLAERIPDQSSRCGVMPTYSTVDIRQQLSSLLDGDASLQDSCVASPVELFSDEDTGLVSSGQPTRLRLVAREDIAKEVI